MSGVEYRCPCGATTLLSEAEITTACCSTCRVPTVVIATDRLIHNLRGVMVRCPPGVEAVLRGEARRDGRDG